ncbi:hypothetical protein Q2Y23_001641 [Vibrio fluvialis]|nr:hypothetical protein [Vibrio fluvialis]
MKSLVTIAAIAAATALTGCSATAMMKTGEPYTKTVDNKHFTDVAESIVYRYGGKSDLHMNETMTIKTAELNDKLTCEQIIEASKHEALKLDNDTVTLRAKILYNGAAKCNFEIRVDNGQAQVINYFQ